MKNKKYMTSIIIGYAILWNMASGYEVKKCNDRVSLHRLQQLSNYESEKLLTESLDKEKRNLLYQNYMVLFPKFTELLIDQNNLSLAPEWRELKIIAPVYIKFFDEYSNVEQMRNKTIGYLFSANYDEVHNALLNERQQVKLDYGHYLLGAITSLFLKTPYTLECLEAALLLNPVKTINSILWFNNHAHISYVHYHNELYDYILVNDKLLPFIPENDKVVMMWELIGKEARQHKYNEFETLNAIDKNKLIDKLREYFKGKLFVIQKRNDSVLLTFKKNSNKENKCVILIEKKNDVSSEAVPNL